MKFYDVDNSNNNLVNSNNTEEEGFGSGSDPITFDSKFGKRKNKTVNWTFEDAGK
jgi:hypothetical protein